MASSTFRPDATTSSLERGLRINEDIDQRKVPWRRGYRLATARDCARLLLYGGSLLGGLHLGFVTGRIARPVKSRRFKFQQLLGHPPAIRGRGAPRHLSTDHDPLFEDHRWQAHLRVLEIDEIKTVPHVPLSHPFVERLIGTTRREFLDHVLFWNARDLERKLADFQAYYNTARIHASLAGNTPLGVAVGSTVARADLSDVRWASHCRGLVQLPMAA